MKKIIIQNEAQRRECHDILDRIPLSGQWSVTFSETSRRNLEQNAKMWAMLTDISRQIDWHGIKMKPESWKDLFSAGLKKSLVVPNLDGDGFVIVGQSTSAMSKKMMSELIELILAFGTERGVKFTATENQGG